LFIWNIFIFLRVDKSWLQVSDRAVRKGKDKINTLGNEERFEQKYDYTVVGQKAKFA